MPLDLVPMFLQGRLEADGVNRNQGTESTLALITTLQHARTMAEVP